MTGSGTETSIGTILSAFASYGQRVALTHSRGQWTFQDLLDEVHRTARALQRRGFGRGDVIALLVGNRPEAFVLRFAANVLGCCTTALYEGLASPTLVGMLRTTDAAAVVFDPTEYDEQLREVVEEVPGIVPLAVGPSRHAADLMDSAARELAEPVAVKARPEDLSAIRLTGGSTGTPKGVPRYFHVPPYLTAEGLRAWSGTVQLLCTPVAHLGGTFAEIALAAGGRVVLHEHFDAGDVLAAVAEQRATFLWLQPRLLHLLLDHPDLDSADTSSLRALNCGGAPSTPHRMAQAVERFGPIVGQGYGTLEVNQATWLTAAEHLDPDLLTTVGRPVSGVELSIRDSAGEPVETGCAGEIWVRGPSVLDGYHRQPEETARALHDGWFRTGDLGSLDARGYLTVVGRIKDVILAAGDRVYPARVEDVLDRHPGVAVVSVFGFADGDNDERVCAAVVPASAGSITEGEVRRWVREQHGPAYEPELVLLLDAIPTTGSQKPDRGALREMAAEMSVARARER